MKFKIDLVLKLNQKQTAKIRKEETNRKTERERVLTWAAHLACPLGGPAHQGHRCLQPLPTGRGVSTRARSPWPPPCLLPPFPALLATPGDVDEAPNRPPSPLVTLPLLPARSRARPNELVTAVRCHRGHRLPLASPTCPGAPPLSPTSLRRLTRRQTPRSVGPDPFFLLGSPRSPPSPCSLRTSPAPTGLPIVLAVRFSSSSPKPRCSPPPLGHSCADAEARQRRTSSPPRPQLLPPASELIRVFVALPGAERVPQLLLSCSAAPFRSLP